MVAGLETFKTFFADFKDCYVLIGGSACDVYFAEQDISPGRLISCRSHSPAI